MMSRLGSHIAGAAIGAVPGVVIVLIAQFVIKGEWQLTIGAPGMVIAAVGFVFGAFVGFRRRRQH